MFEFFPGNKSWSFACIRLMAETYYGGGEFNECHRTIARIRNEDRESWHREWLATAQRVEEKAAKAESLDHLQTAEGVYFRAANYYRLAEFYLAHSDPRKVPTYLRSVTCFRRAICRASGIEAVEVPYGEHSMAGYFLKPPQPGENTPVLIFMGGADSTAEEISFIGCREALLRGIAVIIVDGPGRGGMLRLKNVSAVADYERPTGAIIDYLVARGDVDENRIGLLGVSMGGYYVARAAAFERRVKACVVHFGCYDALADLYDYYPAIQGQMQWLVGAGSDQQARQILGDFNLEGRASQIECPLLILHGEDDPVIHPRGARRLYGEARCQKRLEWFGSGQPGSAHCGYDNQSEIFPLIHDWIQKKLSG